LAPRASSHNESQLPLNPVCPVTNTFRFLQNERLSMTGPGELHHKAKIADGGSDGEKHV